MSASSISSAAPHPIPSEANCTAAAEYLSCMTPYPWTAGTTDSFRGVCTGSPSGRGIIVTNDAYRRFLSYLETNFVPLGIQFTNRSLVLTAAVELKFTNEHSLEIRELACISRASVLGETPGDTAFAARHAAFAANAAACRALVHAERQRNLATGVAIAATGVAAISVGALAAERCAIQ